MGQPRRVRAGPDFEKNFQIRFQILGRGRFLFENRSLADFTGLLGVPGHPSSSGATDPILPTQRIPILSTQRWGDVDEYMKFSGGDLVQNGSFQKVKLANVGGFSDF